MICKNCGAIISDDAIFCSNCGASVAAPAAEPVKAPESAAPLYPWQAGFNGQLPQAAVVKNPYPITIPADGGAPEIAFEPEPEAAPGIAPQSAAENIQYTAPVINAIAPEETVIPEISPDNADPATPQLYPRQTDSSNAQPAAALQYSMPGANAPQFNPANQPDFTQWENQRPMYDPIPADPVKGSFPLGMLIGLLGVAAMIAAIFFPLCSPGGSGISFLDCVLDGISFGNWVPVIVGGLLVITLITAAVMFIAKSYKIALILSLIAIAFCAYVVVSICLEFGFLIGLGLILFVAGALLCLAGALIGAASRKN